MLGMSGALRRRTWSYTEAAVHGHQFDCRTMFWTFGYATYCLCFQVVPISKNCLSKKRNMSDAYCLVGRLFVPSLWAQFYSPSDSVRFSLVNVIIIPYPTHNCCGNNNAHSTGALHAIRHCHSHMKLNVETQPHMRQLRSPVMAVCASNGLEVSIVPFSGFVWGVIRTCLFHVQKMRR